MNRSLIGLWLLALTTVPLTAGADPPEPIGLRAIVSESTGWRARSLDVCMLLTGLLLAAWGMRAVWAVFR